MRITNELIKEHKLLLVDFLTSLEQTPINKNPDWPEQPPKRLTQADELISQLGELTNAVNRVGTALENNGGNKR